MSKLIYIASPYTNKDYTKLVDNYLTVTKYAAKLVEQGDVAFSPITYGHTLVSFRQMPLDFAFWENFCMTFLKKCDEMIVLCIPGWEHSKGVAAEIKLCEEYGIPVVYVSEYEYLFVDKKPDTFGL